VYIHVWLAHWEFLNMSTSDMYEYLYSTKPGYILIHWGISSHDPVIGEEELRGKKNAVRAKKNQSFSMRCTGPALCPAPANWAFWPALPPDMRWLEMSTPLGDGRGTVRLMQRVGWTCWSRSGARRLMMIILALGLSKGVFIRRNNEPYSISWTGVLDRD